MTEKRLRMLSDVGLQLLPYLLVIPYLVAITANRDDTAQHPDFLFQFDPQSLLGFNAVSYINATAYISRKLSIIMVIRNPPIKNPTIDTIVP